MRRLKLGLMSLVCFTFRLASRLGRLGCCAIPCLFRYLWLVGVVSCYGEAGLEIRVGILLAPVGHAASFIPGHVRNSL